MRHYTKNKAKCKFLWGRVSNRLKCVNILPIIKVMSKLKQFKYILLTALFFALSVGFIRSTFNILKSKERLDDVQKEVAEMGKQVRDLNVDIEYKKTDAYIEEKARNDLNMIRPGEQVYVVVDSGKNESSSEVLGTQKKSEKERDSSKDTNWYAWYKLFF